MVGKAAVIHRSLAGAVFAAPYLPQIKWIHAARYVACGIASEDFVERPGKTRTGREAISVTLISVGPSMRDNPELSYCRGILASLKAKIHALWTEVET